MATHSRNSLVGWQRTCLASSSWKKKCSCSKIDILGCHGYLRSVAVRAMKKLCAAWTVEHWPGTRDEGGGLVVRHTPSAAPGTLSMLSE